MKPRTQFLVIGALLLSAVVLSSLKRAAHSDNAGPGRGACCPLMAALDGKPVTAGTNQITTTNSAARQVIAVETEVRTFLSGEGLQTSTNQFGRPPTPSQR